MKFCDTRSNVNRLYLLPFCQQEVLNIVASKLKIKNSSEFDDIPICLFKKCINTIIEPITYLINLSIESECFPTSLKINKVIPILKKGDIKIISKYGPSHWPQDFRISLKPLFYIDFFVF